VTIQRSPRENPIITASQLEGGALDLLQRLLPAYAQGIAKQQGGDTPAFPRSYTCAAALDKFVEDQLPAVVLHSPGTVGKMEQRDGLYSVVWALVVGVYVSASTDRATHDLARLYAAAVRGCLAQTPSLGGLCSDLVWVDERYDRGLAFEAQRTFVVGTTAWEARVNSVVDAFAGPLTALPVVDAGDWPQVETTSVEIDRLPEDAAA
jgi:hypothetical protein